MKPAPRANRYRAEVDSEKLTKAGGIYQNLAAVRTDKGTVSTGTVTFNLADGNVQRLQVGGALTIALSGWPTAGNHAAIKLNIVNGGSATITWPAIQWIQDGTSTTNISTYLSNIGAESTHCRQVVLMNLSYGLMMPELLCEVRFYDGFTISYIGRRSASS